MIVALEKERQRKKIEARDLTIANTENQEKHDRKAIEVIELLQEQKELMVKKHNEEISKLRAASEKEGVKAREMKESNEALWTQREIWQTQCQLAEEEVARKQQLVTERRAKYATSRLHIMKRCSCC